MAGMRRREPGSRDRGGALAARGHIPDFGWLWSEERPRGLDALFPHAVHAHAKTHYFDDKGQETEIDYAAIGALARRCGDCGLFSVEYEGSGEDRVIGVP